MEVEMEEKFAVDWADVGCQMVREGRPRWAVDLKHMQPIP
jgi:hypothetical protein